MSMRQLRVGETMRRVLAEILTREGFSVTITEVRVSPDLRNATIFFLPPAALNVLESNCRRLRSQIATDMRLKHTPSLTFAADRSLEAAQTVNRLLNQPQVARDLVCSAPMSPSVIPSGWFILDKPRGITSTEATARVKRLSGAAKAGHCGTLDPEAEGVLPIALGEATKFARLLVDSCKTYCFALEWHSLPPTREAICSALNTFLGEIEQIPPRLSAIHVNGKRAYVLARAGVEFDLPPRRVHLYSATLLDDDAIEITCSKGFYVRSLARDLASALGTECHITTLRRTAVGPFNTPHTFPEEKQQLLACLQPVESILTTGDIQLVTVSDAEEMRLRWGQGIFLSSLEDKMEVAYNLPCRPMVAERGGQAVALVRRGEKGEVRPVRVLHPHATTSGMQEKQEKQTEER